MEFNNEINEDVKSKKVSRLILVFIILIVLAIIGIICTIMYLQGNVSKTYINSAAVNLPDDTIIVQSGKLYVDIKGIASYLGYDAHNGEYKLFTEDTNKCYVDCENETASFFLNSNKISKMEPDQTKDYEDYTLTDPVISKNGKLYSTIEGIKIGFNVTFDYNETSGDIKIYTLPYLLEQYTTTFKTYGYESLSENFNNQKAILYNMFVVRKENNLYGVVDQSNKEVIGSRYKDMEFNESAREYYVLNTTNKAGIVTEQGVTKINLLYDEINVLDKDLGLYVVKSNNKYGVLGNTGNTVIHLEYDKIGTNTTQFPSNSIKNKYLLLENAIPVCQNKKWGLFDITGNLIVPVEFDTLGYTSGATGNLSGKVVNNLLVIPTQKAIVLGKTIEKNKKYAIYDNKGNQLVPCQLDNAYSVTNAGVDTYYMEYNGYTLNIEEYIERVYGTTNNITNNTNNTNSTQTNTIVEENTITDNTVN